MELRGTRERVAQGAGIAAGAVLGGGLAAEAVVESRAAGKFLPLARIARIAAVPFAAGAAAGGIGAAYLADRSPRHVEIGALVIGAGALVGVPFGAHAGVSTWNEMPAVARHGLSKLRFAGSHAAQYAMV